MATSDRLRTQAERLIHDRPDEGRPGDEGDEHDRGLIVERLGWTPEERLAANAAFLRFYLTIQPNGPLIDRD